jgi:hypothetical protein
MGEVELPDGPSGDWRGDLTLLAWQIRVVGLRHPWLIALLTSRPTLGPALLRVHEFALGAFDGIDVDIDDVMGFVGMLNDHIHSAIRREIGWLEEARRTGLDPERWKRDYIGPYVRQVVESGAFPLFSRTLTSPQTSASGTGSTASSMPSPHSSHRPAPIDREGGLRCGEDCVRRMDVVSDIAPRLHVDPVASDALDFPVLTLEATNVGAHARTFVASCDPAPHL